jgi:hypothetical protein
LLATAVHAAFIVANWRPVGSGAVAEVHWWLKKITFCGAVIKS